MAALKKTKDGGKGSSRSEYYIPYSDGAYDTNQGFLRDVVLRQEKDKVVGDKTYFVPRPSFTTQYAVFLDKTQAFSENSPAYNNMTMDARYGYRVSKEGFFVLQDGPDSVNAWEETNLVAKYSGNPVRALTSGSTGYVNMGAGQDINWAWNLAIRNFDDSYIRDNLSMRITRFDNTDVNKTSYFITVPTYNYSDTQGHGGLLFIHTTNNDDNTQEFQCYLLPFRPSCFPVTLDGMIFVPKVNSDVIYNCEVNDITHWNVDVNLIRASQFPGKINMLSRINNYIVALKENSIEFMYNAGLSDTSPLQRNTSYTKQIGLLHPSTLVSINDKAWFMGREINGQPRFYELTETQCLAISTPYVESGLVNMELDNTKPTLVTSYRPYYLSLGSKRFYVFQLGPDYSSPYQTFASIAVQYVYDVDEKTWYMWSKKYVPSAGNEDYSPGVLSILPNSRALVVGEGNTLQIANVRFNTAGHVFNDEYWTGINRTGGVTTHSGSTYNYISPLFITPAIDFGTMNRKFIRQLSVSTSGLQSVRHTIISSTLNGVEGEKQWTKSADTSHFLNFQNYGYGQVFTFRHEILPLTPHILAATARVYGMDVTVDVGVS